METHKAGVQMKSAHSLAAALLLGGCAVNSTVRYQAASDPMAVAAARHDLIDSYVLQKNELRIEFKNTAADGKPPNFDLSVVNTKLEDQSRRLMLLRGDRFWTRTTLNISKVENTDLVASVGVEVEDRRIELIQTGGAILKNLIPFAPGVAGQGTPVPVCGDFPKSPCSFVPTDSLTTMKKEKASIGDKSVFWFEWGAISSTAEESDTVLPNLSRQRRNGLYYAACRDFVVRYVEPVAAGGKVPTQAKVYEWRGKIADPRYVEFVAFPRKGNVRMHAQCGVSTTSEKDPTKTTDAVISEAITQAIAVRAALDKAEADAKK